MGIPTQHSFSTTGECDEATKEAVLRDLELGIVDFLVADYIPTCPFLKLLLLS
jgi:hypothetical protein